MNAAAKHLILRTLGRPCPFVLPMFPALAAYASTTAENDARPTPSGATVDLRQEKVQRFARAIAPAVLALTLAADFAGSARACSQCICGTPFPAAVVGGVVPTQLAYGLEERYLSKTSGLDDGPGEEQELEHRVAGFALWRPWNRLALVGRLPYNFKQVNQHVPGLEPSSQTSSGIGDAELLALVGVARGSGRHPVTVGLVLGGSVPTGSNELRGADGERLDIHLQPGTGAWSGTGGLHLATSRSTGTWDGSLLGRISGTSSHGYRYGSALLYNGGFTSSEWRGVRLLAQIDGRSAGKDRLESGAMGANTGGSVMYAAPGLRWQTTFGLVVEGSVQVPFRQHLYGDQTEHTTGRFTLSMSR